MACKRSVCTHETIGHLESPAATGRDMSGERCIERREVCVRIQQLSRNSHSSLDREEEGEEEVKCGVGEQEQVEAAAVSAFLTRASV